MISITVIHITEWSDWKEQDYDANGTTPKITLPENPFAEDSDPEDAFYSNSTDNCVTFHAGTAYRARVVYIEKPKQEEEGICPHAAEFRNDAYYQLCNNVTETNSTEEFENTTTTTTKPPN